MNPILSTVSVPMTLETLNIFGIISDILEYKTRIREIDAEIARVQIQADVMCHKIDKEHDIAIRSLMIQREQMNHKFQALAKEQDNYVLEQAHLLQMMRDLVNALISAKTISEKNVLNNVIVTIRALIDGNQKKQVNIVNALMANMDNQQIFLGSNE